MAVVGVEDGTSGLLEEWKNVGVVLSYHLACGVVVACAEDGFEFGFGFGEYALYLGFHVYLVVDECSEVFEGVADAKVWV